MYTHAFLGSNDVERSRPFYDAVMGALGYTNLVPPQAGKLIYSSGEGTLVVGKPLNGEPATPSNGATLGFAAKSDEMVDAWHKAGLGAGGTCDGAPGNRPASPNNSYGAYLRDPDGNKLTCFHMKQAQ